MEFNVGQQVLVGDRKGIIVEPPYPMPLHHLIQFDSGELQWILREIVTSAPAKRSRSKKAV